MNPSSDIAQHAQLLMVDADANARSIMAQGLRQNGYVVTEVSSGAETMSLLAKTSFDLVVLELELPRVSGIEVMHRVRAQQREMPIIVLTAHPSVDSAIAAVRAGVVDYLLKPCAVQDLALTIARALEERAAQLRQQRMMQMVGQVLDALREPTPPNALPVTTANVVSMSLMDVGLLSLDREKRMVTLKMNPPRTVELTEGEVAILVILMEHPNQVFTCDQLAQAALGYKGMDKWTVESVVRSSVFRLRNKIELGPDAPRLIRTVRGRGYFFSPVAQS